ncbi:DUF969 family protein, partial [Pseudomonas sp.]|uniref:5-oxoproline transporter, DUF969 family subunit n=1 Tax=Pseudomonas sp. TaxID=306 RepID=UPI00258D3B6B
LPEALRQRLLAFCAATDNVGLFFGEDIFVAFGAIALMHTFLLGAGLDVEPLHIALWGIPTALCAFFIHALRLHRFDHFGVVVPDIEHADAADKIQVALAVHVPQL